MLDALLATSSEERTRLHKLRPYLPWFGLRKLQRTRICTSVITLRLQRFWALGHGQHLILNSYFDSSFDDDISEPSSERPWGRNPEAYFDVPFGAFNDMSIEGIFWAAWEERIHPQAATHRKLLALEPKKLIRFEIAPPPQQPDLGLVARLSDRLMAMSDTGAKWVHTGRSIDGYELRYIAEHFDVSDPVSSAQLQDNLSALADVGLKLVRKDDDAVLLGRSNSGILYVVIFVMRESLVDGKTYINVIDIIPNSDYKEGAFGTMY